ncbi:hypothetical protein [Streptomyces sp. NPDC053079]|uniref:hypothetical protein n=1 Tax=Streptomyces sp. NPDC053079 TaxID=3365697 RepID=UPI0037D67958
MINQPTQITVTCGRCGHKRSTDDGFSDRVPLRERHVVVRTLLAVNEGWQCDEDGDLCPACAAPDTTANR